MPTRLYGEGYVADKAMAAEFERRARAAAKKYVSAIARAAREAGVDFEPLTQTARASHSAAWPTG